MMREIFVFIPDMALREAVLEQMKATKIAHAHLVDTLPAFLNFSLDTEICLIIDEAGYDKKARSLIRQFIDKGGNATILVLGNAGDGEDVTETFAKPFRLGHLMTRLGYHLETAPLLRNRIIDFGPYRLEIQNRRIVPLDHSESIKLTEKETALLVFLVDQGSPSTRRDILAAVWGYDERIDTHTLETHIYQLRRKLDKDGDNWLIFESGAYHLARVQT